MRKVRRNDSRFRSDRDWIRRRGYGRAIARRFARDRTAVVVSDINEQVEARPTVQLIQVTGGHSV